MMGRLQGVMERLILLGLAAVPTALAKKIVSVSGVCTTAADGNLLFGCWRGPPFCWSPGGVWGLSRAYGKRFRLCQRCRLLVK